MHIRMHVLRGCCADEEYIHMKVAHMYIRIYTQIRTYILHTYYIHTTYILHTYAQYMRTYVCMQPPCTHCCVVQESSLQQGKWYVLASSPAA